MVKALLLFRLPGAPFVHELALHSAGYDRGGGRLSGLSLCAGAGGLDLGLHLAVPCYRTVGYVEREAYAAAALVARMEDAALDSAPVWGDVASFDSKPWRGIVDIIHGGYPCQPFSIAGRRQGTADPRHLWPHFARIIGECEPRFVFLENVAHHLRLGFPEVAAELVGLGYRLAAGIFAASEVGAPHRRERLFALACRANDAMADPARLCRSPLERRQSHRVAAPVADAASQRQREPADETGAVAIGGSARDEPRNLGVAVADAASARQPLAREPGAGGEIRDAGGRQEPERRGGPVADAADGQLSLTRRRTAERTRSRPDGAGIPRGSMADPESERRGQTGESKPHPRHPVVDDANRARPQGWRGQSGEHAGERPAWPPGPEDADGWREFLKRAPDLEPAVCRGSDGLANRVDRLRLCGNGVVPLVAAYALRTLAAELIAGG